MENITAANGWTIAFLGIFIVFICLIMLTISVEIFHWIIYFFENKEQTIRRLKRKINKKPAMQMEYNFALAIKQFILLTKEDTAFALPKLLEKAKSRGLTKPYSTVANMIEKKLMFADGHGFFVFDKKKCKKFIEDF